MKVLVVGLGSIGQRHVRNLRTLAGTSVDLTAYRVRKLAPVLTEDMTVEAGTDVETRYNIAAFDRLEDALADRPDAVLVCNPTRHHIPVALAAAAAGCHLLVEKPLSDRYDGVDDLIRVVEQKRLVATVGYQMRFHPALQQVRDLVDRQTIGRVFAVRAQFGEFLPAVHPYEDYRCSYAARSDLGGGVVLSHSHELDYLYWLFGLPRRVFALGGHLSRLEVDVEDTASIMMECVVAGHTVPVHVSLNFAQRPPGRSLEIVGDAGTIRLDLRALTFDVIDERGVLASTAPLDDFDRNELFLAELRHFLACVQGSARTRVSLRDAAQSLRMALAARQSMDSGEVVELR